MQPGMAGLVRAERQQGVVRVVASTAAKAAAGWRAHRIAVEPFGDATGEGAGLGLIAWQAAVELGNARPLVEQGSPVLARPAVATRALQRDHARLVKRQKFEHGGRRRGGGVEHEGIAIDADPNAGIARGLEGLDSAHSRTLQPVFSGAD